MKKIVDKSVGNLTIEIYDGNSVVKVKNALVKITGHYKPPGHFKKSASFSANTDLLGVVEFINIPLDMYTVEVSRKGYKPTIVKDVSAKIFGKDPVGNFVKPKNLAKIIINHTAHHTAKTWDSVTNKRILTLHQNVQGPATVFINEVKAKLGIRLRVTDALRTNAEQNSLYAQGRTKPGLVVTGAKAGESYHNYGLAIDVVEITNSGNVNYSTNWSAIEKVGVNNGFSWGGNWPKPDKPHFQMNFGLSISQLQRGSRP